MKKAVYLSICFMGLICTLLCCMLYNGLIWFVNPQGMGYTVTGVDVSHYQGDIDWNRIAAQDIRFAFVKATEGSTFVDPCFLRNYEEAMEAGIATGAYHFFSFQSPGKDQAENFIQRVPLDGSSLPPVLDVELYGPYVTAPPDPEEVRREIGDFVAAIEDYYGTSPILYSTYDDFARYLAGYYPQCPIWIRNLFREPGLPDGREFTFWQYSNRDWLEGYNGEEFFIDLNVYNGTWQDFQREFQQYGEQT